MDNQFRNVKTHARLLSKAMWYEWRMKLLEGLKEGLDRHVDEMKADDEALTEQEESLHGVVPGLVEKHIALETEAHDLQQMIDEIKNCDQNELLQAREKLSSIEAVTAAKKKLLESMQEDLQGKVETIEAGSELKAEFLEQIHEAERVKEECRGWSVSEVNALKGELNIKLHLYTRFKSLVLRNRCSLCPNVRESVWLVNHKRCVITSDICRAVLDYVVQ